MYGTAALNTGHEELKKTKIGVRFPFKDIHKVEQNQKIININNKSKA